MVIRLTVEAVADRALRFSDFVTHRSSRLLRPEVEFEPNVPGSFAGRFFRSAGRF
jgi:hypothetical protein